MPNRHFIICTNDDGEYVFATRRFFSSKEAASAYASSIAKKRKPIVIKAGALLIAEQTAKGVGIHGEYKEWLNDKFAANPVMKALN